MTLSDRLAVAALVVLLLLAPVLAEAARAEENWVEQTIADRAAAHGVGAWWLTALARCESSLDPNAVGDHGGSLGLFQLSTLRTGLVWDFYAAGYADPFSVWESADYTASVLAGERRGVSIRRWSCWRLIGGW